MLSLDMVSSFFNSLPTGTRRPPPPSATVRLLVGFPSVPAADAGANRRSPCPESAASIDATPEGEVPIDLFRRSCKLRGGAFHVPRAVAPYAPRHAPGKRSPTRQSIPRGDSRGEVEWPTTHRVARQALALSNRRPGAHLLVVEATDVPGD